ncbi:MAG: hypothetical protein ACK56F_01160, partial [bacterium]
MLNGRQFGAVRDSELPEHSLVEAGIDLSGGVQCAQKPLAELLQSCLKPPRRVQGLEFKSKPRALDESCID